MKAFHIYITVQIIDSLICIVQKFDQAAVVAQSPRAFALHVEGWCSNPSLDIPKSWKR